MVSISPVYLHDEAARRLYVVHCDRPVRNGAQVQIKPKKDVIGADNILVSGRRKYATRMPTVETWVTTLDDAVAYRYALAAIEAACDGGRYMRVSRDAALVIKAEYEAEAGSPPQLLSMP
jgi:hypothetical protein